jgi:hypothetical protein
MSAVAALARAKRAEICLSLRPDGNIRAEPAPPPDLLAEIRANKAGIIALLVTAAGARALPTCPGCDGQRFWRDTTGGNIGDWTCARAKVPPAVRQVDILGPCRGEPTSLVCVVPAEAVDREMFARLIATHGGYVALGRTTPLPCRQTPSGWWAS